MLRNESGDRQSDYWLNNSADTIASDIRNARTKHTFNYVRVNESGDFYSQDCIKKLVSIASKHRNLIFYTYSHRKDLDFSNLPENVILSGSGFKLDNAFHSVAIKKGALAEFIRQRRKHDKKAVRCIGDCSKCNACKTNNNLTILCAIH